MTTPEDKSQSAWASLREPVFRELWIASLVSNIGGWMQSVGAAWLMTSLTSSALMVAMVQSAGSLPVVLLALPAGALADIADRRTILLISQFWMLTAAAALASLAFANSVTPLMLLALTCALGMGNALMGPAFQAVITEVVPSSQMSSAVSLNSAGFNLARAVGPAMGGLILAKAGAGFAFLLNAVSFLAVIVVLVKWKADSRRSVLPAERFVGAVRGGLRYVRYAPALRAVLCRTAGFVIFGSALWALLPLVVRDELRLGPSAYGMTLGALGVGAVLGALVLPVLRRRYSREILVIGNTVVFALVIGSTVLLRSYPLLLVPLAAAGAAWMILLSVLNVAVRSVVPAWVEARVLAAYLIIFQGGTASGSVLWGEVTAKMGLRWALLCAGAGLFLTLLLVFRYPLSAIDTLNVAPAPTWAAPPLLDASLSAMSPALVTIHYEVDTSRTSDFRKAMHRMEGSRRRGGATCWGLFADPVRPGVYMEHFLVESWVEHLRQHDRTVADDSILEETIRRMQRGPDPPLVTHYIADERKDG